MQVRPTNTGHGDAHDGVGGLHDGGISDVALGKALNFQLIALIGYIVGSILTVIFIGFLISAAVWVISLIYGIGNYQKVQRGEATTYPVNVTWVK